MNCRSITALRAAAASKEPDFPSAPSAEAISAAAGDKEVPRQELGLEHVGLVPRVELKHLPASLPFPDNNVQIVAARSNFSSGLVEVETVDTAFVAAQFCRQFESFDKVGRAASSRRERGLHPQPHLA